MTTDPIKNIVINTFDAGRIKASVPAIRESIKDCQFDIESLVLLGALLDKVERAAELKTG